MDTQPCAEFGALGWQVHVAADLKAAERLLTEHRLRVGLLLSPEGDDGGWNMLDEFLHSHAALEWVGVFDARALASPACRELIVARLFDHHTLPISAAHVAMTLGHAHGHAVLRESTGAEPAAPDHFGIIGRSMARAAHLAQIRRIAKVDAPVLISGESGSGKELAARAIHSASARAERAFVAVNCGAIQSSLIQSELFGHAKGAFTGAVREKRGFIEAADGGTVFLDEIGDLTLDLQTNLLRFLQEETINRVGSTEIIKVNVRVIAATHVNVEEAVAAGTFREDLFYRLNVLPLRVPALRERKGDIELLAQHCFDKFARDKSPRLKGFSQRALAAMDNHDWRGNVRELINRVRRAMVMAEGRLIVPADLGLQEAVQWRSQEALGDTRTKAERDAISVGLQRAGSNVTRAARHLGISRMTLYRLMAKHGIHAAN